jgi:hypothetical protein
LNVKVIIIAIGIKYNIVIFLFTNISLIAGFNSHALPAVVIALRIIKKIVKLNSGMYFDI